MLSNLALPAIVFVFLFEQPGPTSTPPSATPNAASSQGDAAATAKPSDVDLIEVEKQMLEKTNAQRAALRFAATGGRQESGSNRPRARRLDDE